MSDYYEMAEETLGGILGGVSNSIEIFATDRDVLDTLTRKPLIAPELLLKGARIFLCISEQEEPIIKPEQFATLKEAVLLTPWGLQRIQKMPYYKSKGNKFSENF